MGRLRKPYCIRKIGKIYYYKLPHEKTYHSTGQTYQTKAEKFVIEIVKQNKTSLNRTFKEYANDFFLPEKCPHIRRLKEEKKSIGQRYIKEQRKKLEKYIFIDTVFSNKKMQDITRGDILDFRTRLINKNVGMNSINKIIGVLKIVFREALFREELFRDPTSGLGNIKYQTREKGIFSIEEIKQLFPKDSLGPWKSLKAYTCFLMAALTGMRRGEILALHWKNVYFKEKYILVCEAWKDKDIIGLPKWNHKRITAIPNILIKKLVELKDESLMILPDNLVFCYEDGSRLGNTWWNKNFHNAIKKIGINAKERNLAGHCLRHSLNSILIDTGINKEIIRKTLGWNSVEIQDHYTHQTLIGIEEQATTINNLFK